MLALNLVWAPTLLSSRSAGLLFSAARTASYGTGLPKDSLAHDAAGTQAVREQASQQGPVAASGARQHGSALPTACQPPTRADSEAADAGSASGQSLGHHSTWHGHQGHARQLPAAHAVDAAQPGGQRALLHAQAERADSHSEVGSRAVQATSMGSDWVLSRGSSAASSSSSSRSSRAWSYRPHGTDGMALVLEPKFAAFLDSGTHDALRAAMQHYEAAMAADAAARASAPSSSQPASDAAATSSQPAPDNAGSSSWQPTPDNNGSSFQPAPGAVPSSLQPASDQAGSSFQPASGTVSSSSQPASDHAGSSSSPPAFGTADSASSPPIGHVPSQPSHSSAQSAAAGEVGGSGRAPDAWKRLLRRGAASPVAAAPQPQQQEQPQPQRQQQQPQRQQQQQERRRQQQRQQQQQQESSPSPRLAAPAGLQQHSVLAATSTKAVTAPPSTGKHRPLPSVADLVPASTAVLQPTAAAQRLQQQDQQQQQQQQQQRRPKRLLSVAETIPAAPAPSQPTPTGMRQQQQLQQQQQRQAKQLKQKERGLASIQAALDEHAQDMRQREQQHQQHLLQHFKRPATAAEPSATDSAASLQQRDDAAAAAAGVGSATTQPLATLDIDAADMLYVKSQAHLQQVLQQSIQHQQQQQEQHELDGQKPSAAQAASLDTLLSTLPVQAATDTTFQHAAAQQQSQQHVQPEQQSLQAVLAGQPPSHGPPSQGTDAKLAAMLADIRFAAQSGRSTTQQQQQGRQQQQGQQAADLQTLLGSLPKAQGTASPGSAEASVAQAESALVWALAHHAAAAAAASRSLSEHLQVLKQQQQEQADAPSSSSAASAAAAADTASLDALLAALSPQQQQSIALPSTPASAPQVPDAQSASPTAAPPTQPQPSRPNVGYLLQALSQLQQQQPGQQAGADAAAGRAATSAAGSAAQPTLDALLKFLHRAEQAPNRLEAQLQQAVQPQKQAAVPPSAKPDLANLLRQNQSAVAGQPPAAPAAQQVPGLESLLKGVKGKDAASPGLESLLQGVKGKGAASPGLESVLQGVRPKGAASLEKAMESWSDALASSWSPGKGQQEQQLPQRFPPPPSRTGSGQQPRAAGAGMGTSPVRAEEEVLQTANSSLTARLNQINNTEQEQMGKEARMALMNKEKRHGQHDKASSRRAKAAGDEGPSDLAHVAKGQADARSARKALQAEKRAAASRSVAAAAAATSKWASRLSAIKSTAGAPEAAAAAVQGSVADADADVAAAEQLEVVIPSDCSVRHLAGLLGARVSDLETLLASLGETVHSAEDLVSAESAELAALEYNRVAVFEDTALEALPRPPVVTIMGHVDHGKTSLLDALRKTSVAASEAGGITQHIGAFQVTLPAGASITFLDTPGHAAFSAMRARGAAVTDIVVLVVAADDGIMPQTREALAHARAAEVPIVVALTKCDVDLADPERVKMQLLAEGVELEEYGGTVQCIEVAAPKGVGLEELEEALNLQAEVMELKAPLQCKAEAVVVEAQMHKGLGPVATVIVRRGQLKVGDPIAVGTEYGKVRALLDSAGTHHTLDGVGPGQHAQVSGLRGLPSAGDELVVVESEGRAEMIARARGLRAEEFRRGQLARAKWEATKRAQQAAALAASRKRELKARLRDLTREKKKHTTSDLMSHVAELVKGRDEELLQQTAASTANQLRASLEEREQEEGQGEQEVDEAASRAALIAAGRCLHVLIKADVQGSVEAVRAAVLGLSSKSMAVNVVYAGVGPVTSADVNLAAAAGAQVLGFGVPPTAPDVESLARGKGIKVLNHNVIYRLLEHVGSSLEGAAPMEEVEEVVGQATVVQVFPLLRKGKAAGAVAGCRVSEGSIQRSAPLFRVLRGEQVVYEGPCTNLRRHKLDVDAVGKSNDCGVVLGDGAFGDYRPGDVVQCVQRVSKRASVEH